MTVFSKSKKSELLLNSSISVSGLGGAVEALIGINFGNSNSSSSLRYCPFLLFFPYKSLYKFNCYKRYNLLFWIEFFFAAFRTILEVVLILCLVVDILVDLTNKLLSLENSGLMDSSLIHLVDADDRMASSTNTSSATDTGNILLSTSLVVLLSIHNCLSLSMSLCLGCLIC